MAARLKDHPAVADSPRVIPAEQTRIVHPSRWWLVLAVVCGVMTAAATTAAIIVQRNATTPIGEGEVFVADTARAAEIIMAAPGAGVGVRQARNILGVEAVSLLDDQGRVVASTSDPLIGGPAPAELLMYGAAERRFIALATTIEGDLWLDDVVLWPAGTVLYQVVAPMETEGALMIHYDVSALLGRRTQPGEIQPETLQLLGLSTVFAIFGGVVLMGRSRAVRRAREVEIESEFLRAHSTELQAANEDLERARHLSEEALALAEEKLRIRSEFVLMINHELRTPLTSVVTGARLLRSSDLSGADRQVVLDSMITDGARLQEMIDQILAVARIENTGLSYELIETPYRAVLDTVARVHPACVSNPGEDAPDLVVRTDLGALALVVGSLVDNAFTHGAETVSVGCAIRETITPQLRVGRMPSSAVHVIVADDGPGISMGFLPRIFEKFEKSSFSPGTGLGLYMARMIVDALEGSIAVETSQAGTTFQVSLPMVKAPQRVRVTT